MGRYNVIRLRTTGVPSYDEAILDTAAAPGMNVVIAADGKYDPGAGVASAEQFNLVTEDYNVLRGGKGVDDAYPVGEPCSIFNPLRGDIVAVLLKQNEDVAIGNLLKADGAGLWVKTATAPAKLCALEALNPTTGNALIRCRVL